MLRGRSIVALFALLVVALLPFAGALVSGDVCTDDCGPDCGDCIVCGQVGRLGSPVGLSRAPATRLEHQQTGLLLESIAARAIEHVPLRRA